MRTIFFVIVTAFLVSACSVEPLKPIVIETSHERIDYIKDVKPILDKRCVVCHSCYNSPCQLKLSSFEGLDRGSSKEKVYLAERIFAQDPSRLLVDAKNTKEWRDKKFSSVTDSKSQKGTNNSILLHLLNHKMNNPKIIGDYFSESDKLKCSKDVDELAEFLDDNPNQGMPFGFPALKKDEFETIAAWLDQGATPPTKDENIAMRKPSEIAQKEIDKFEEFFNNQDAKNIMSARYIYEHLFLAHIVFSSAPGEYFELVRSSAASPKPIEVIPTLRPYDNPKIDKFYYRFEKIHSTIDYKTNIVYKMDDKKLQRYKELFIESEWTEKPHVMTYDSNTSAQPFVSFAQIPASSRYKFLLDDSEYMVRTFVHGPVCKGQIALNVLDDHFWVMFMDPKYDLSIKDDNFLKSQYKNLIMPISEGSTVGLIHAISDRYNDASIKYSEDRQNMYDGFYKNGLTMESIWKGENSSDSPFLTIYRHYDNASVHKGVLGALPKTAWIIDYPLLERIYYSLVAGFDVYGNGGHQLVIRRYANRLRVEGEVNFVNLLPKEDRKKMIDSWYLDASDDEKFSISKNETGIKYRKNNSKRELIERVVENHLLKSTNISFDNINYRREDERVVAMPKTFNKTQDYMDGFKALTKDGTAFARVANWQSANSAYIRIKMPKELGMKDIVISAVLNRWHNNVSFMYNEESRLDASKNYFDFINGFVGAYPNLFFVVEFKDLPDFFDMIKNFKDDKNYMSKFSKYGISRDSKDFWENYDWFQSEFNKSNWVDGGLFDLNRYYYKSF